jgi:hypothetical protein
MKTCKDLNIELCHSCCGTGVGSCWISYWEISWKMFPYSIEKRVAEYLELPTNVLDTNYRLYFREAAKLYNPKLYNTIQKLMVLE